MTDALCALTAGELASAFRRGDITPDEVLVAMLQRIAALNPILNAIVTFDEAGAHAAAAASTRRWRGGAPIGPLDGVPITIKDSICTGGLRTTWGSALYADHVPEVDETPVARLRAAGMVILGKTNVPELTVQGFTDNPLFGVTRNPWDPALTPGGSSGGAVAAVASGMGPLALCTDGGGSTRRPAAHTGLIGFKPSRGRVPRGIGFPVILHDFEVAGIAGSCIEDVALAMNVIGDPPRRQTAPHGETRLRILYAPTFGGAPVDPAIAAHVHEVARTLERQGHHVETVADFTLADPVADIWPVISQVGVSWLASHHRDGISRVGPAIAAMARCGAAYSACDYLAAIDAAKSMTRTFAALFERYDLLLTPTTAALPWPAQQSHPETIAAVSVGPRGHAVFTPFANAAALPAISLPCAVADADLPIGAQLVAAKGRDQFLLRVAGDYLAQTGWRFRWPIIASGENGGH